MKIRKCKYNFGNNNDGVFSTINGYATETNNFGETAVGILNKSTLDPDTFTSPDVVTSSKATLFSVGNGSDNVRKNAFEIKANGDTYINGVGGYDGTNSEDATSVGESIQSVQDSSNKAAEDIESIHIEKSGIGNTYVLKVAGEDRGTITDESGVSFTPGDGLQLVDTDLSVKIDSTSESYLTVGQDGLKISGIDAKFGDYLPLSGGEMTGRISNNGSFFDSGIIGVDISDTGLSMISLSGFTSYDGTGEIGIALNTNRIDNWNNWGIVDAGLNIRTENGITRYGPNGVSLPKKTASDLLNAAGSTTPISNIATQVQAAIVDSAPETLDTLNELAAALGDDPNFATTVTNQIAQKADKTTATTSTDGLMSAADKQKLDSIEISTLATKEELNGYLPLSGGDVTGKIFSENTIEIGSKFTAEGQNFYTPNSRISLLGFSNYSDPHDSDTDAVYIVGKEVEGWNNWGAVHPGMTIHTASGLTRYGASGIAIPNKTASDLLNAARGTVSINDIISQTYTQYAGKANGLATLNDTGKIPESQLPSLEYTLPVASATQLGGVRVGDGLEITGEGVLNCTIDPGSGTVSWNNIQGKPTFSTVATSGLYSDLTGTPDLSNYVTSTQLTSIAGSNTYTGANYISKETNLTDAVVQLDEEIKATNDNLALEHANAEATYAKKTELSSYLPLSGGTVSGSLDVNDRLQVRHGGRSCIEISPSSDIFDGSIELGVTTEGPFIYLGPQSDSTRMRIESGGISIRNKTSSDLLNAAGSTTKLKTINSQSLLGEGNIEIQVEGGGITDAPSDNKLYGRKNAQWTEVTLPEVEVPTKVSELINDSGFQTEAQVSAKISALVDSAPETLDTLNELAAALGDDPNFATTIITQLGNKLDVSTYNSDKATFALKSELPSVESITTTDINALFS